MRKNYRSVIRLICVAILLVAAGIVLVHKGAIPRFWERTAQVEQPADMPEEKEPPQPEKAPEEEEPPQPGEAPEEEEPPQPDKAQQADSDEKPEEPEISAQSQPQQAQDQQPEDSQAQELLAEYLQDDPRVSTEAKGIFVTGPAAGTSKMMSSLVEMVEKTELNAMVIDIKNDTGEVTYQMGLPLAEEIGAEVRYVSDMQELVRQLKEKGIYLIARIVAFKDPILAEKKPEYAVKNKNGTVFYDNQGLAWVNPYREEVWDYLIDLSKEAVELGFDEIQYDYIRFSTAEGIAKADFGAESKGKTRQEAINGFLSRAYETLAPMGAFVSVDVFGTIICNESDGKLIGQNYVEMAKNCDYICPMIYPSHYVNNAYGIKVPDAKPYELIYAAVADGEKRLKKARKADDTAHIAKQRPWLQAFTATWVQGHISYRGKQLQDQVKGAGDAGVGEWLLWNASNNYDNVKNGLKK